MAEINSFSNPTYFNGDVTFYKDVTIGGEFKYDNLSVKNLEVTEKSTLGILTVTGNSTLGNVKISSGIVTASSGIVTYYGDGNNLEVSGSPLSESITSALSAAWEAHPSNPISLEGSSSATVSNLPSGIKSIRLIFHQVKGQDSDLQVQMNSSSVFWNHKSAAAILSGSTYTSTDSLIVARTDTNKGIFGVMEIHQEEDTGDWVEWNMCTAHEYNTSVVQGRSGTGIVYPNVDADVEEITFSYDNGGNFSSGSRVYVYYIRDYSQGLAASDEGSGASLTYAGGGIIPTGGIIMWSGTIAAIPSGWVLCDGTNGTPDLRDRFIVGAYSDAASGVTFNANTGVVSGNYAPGNTGGETSHQLTVAELAAHTHRVGSRDSLTEYGTSSAIEFTANYPSPVGQYVTSDTTGGDDYHENRPPYYALAFIMKT